MLKRILVFLAIGVSFAPAAFAMNRPHLPKVEIAQAGENSAHRMALLSDNGGSDCINRAALKALLASDTAQEAGIGGSAAGAK